MSNLTDLEIEAEIGKKNGRPRVVRFNSILKSLPTTDLRVVTNGIANIDFSMTAEVLSVLGAINLEMALGSEDVALKDRVEWTLKMAPFLSQLREGFTRKKGNKLPKTTAALAEESAKRSASIKKLIEALSKTPTEAGKIASEEILEDEDDNDAA